MADGPTSPERAPDQAESSSEGEEPEQIQAQEQIEQLRSSAAASINACVTVAGEAPRESRIWSPQELPFVRVIIDSEDDSPRLVFADWLDEHDDPRGEFIRAQCAMQTMHYRSETYRALEQRQRELLHAHTAKWLGPLAGFSAHLTFRRGFPHSIASSFDRFVSHEAELGEFPIREISLSRDVVTTWHGRRYGVAPNAESKQFADFLSIPWLSRWRDLSLDTLGLGDAGLHRLLQTHLPAVLRRLDVGRNDITAQGMRRFFEVEWPHLHCLDLSRNLSSLTMADVHALMELIPTLQYLGLEYALDGESFRSLDSLDLILNSSRGRFVPGKLLRTLDVAAYRDFLANKNPGRFPEFS